MLSSALGACDKKSSSGTPAASSSAAAAAKAAVAELPATGTLDLEIDDDATTMKVGAAYATPSPHGDGNLYSFRAFNNKATETSCSTKINGDSPVGGDNWAVSLDMNSGAAPFKAGDKDKDYDDVITSVYFVSKTGPWKGKARGLNPFAEEAEKKLTIVSADAQTVTVKVDVSNKSGHVKGEFKAKVCPPAP
jgi:hypothetical protein